VEDFLRHLLESSHGLPAYLSVFGVLVVCGLGVPLPEDISLIMGGFLAYRGSAHLPSMMVVGFLGILVGDTLIYLAGRRVGDRVAEGRSFFARIVTPEKRARVEALFAGHGEKIVILARFLPGVRAVTYFTAGSARMSYLRFIAFDGLAALVSAPLFVYLGYRFGGELDLVLGKIRDGQVAVIGAIVTAVVLYLVLRRWRASVQKRAQKAQEDAQLLASQAQATAAPQPGAPGRSTTSVRVGDATSG
jgi:membrane protein DedA with SNARE-associated domain